MKDKCEDIYDIDQITLSNNIKELLNEAYYHKIKIQLNQILNDIDFSNNNKNNNNNNNNYNLKEKIIEILTYIKSPHQLLNQDQDIQNRFLHSPLDNHQIFNPITTNLKNINKIINIINCNNSNNQIIEQLNQIYSHYKESHESFISNSIKLARDSEVKPPSFDILKQLPLLFMEDLNEYQIKSLNLAYEITSYNPKEFEYKRKNESGLSYGSIVNNKVYFKLDKDEGKLLNPIKEYSIYQLYKHLYPTSTSTIISASQIIIIDQFKILPSEHTIRLTLGGLKTKHNTQSIQEKSVELIENNSTLIVEKVLENVPEFRKELEDASQTKEIFLQASLFKSGITLQKYLEQCEINNDTDYNQIDLESFSSHILSSLLVIPTDYKPDNLILEHGTNRIIGIDNDRALKSFEFKKKQSGNIYPRNKNILFTLKSLMNQQINQHVKDQFIQHNPSLFVLKWLLLVKNKHSNYHSLISKLFELNTQVDTNSKEMRIYKIKENLNLPIQFYKGWITQMIQRFQTIKRLLLENTNVTHQDLFNTVYPLTSKYYELLSTIHSKPIDLIISIYRKEFSFNKLLETNNQELHLLDTTKLKQQLEESILFNSSIKYSLQEAILEAIQFTSFNDLSECKILSNTNECLNHNCENSHKTKSTIMEWLELVFKIGCKGYGGSDLEFHNSWHKEKESIFKLLLQSGVSESIISNIIKSLNITINNNNFMLIINNKDIINNDIQIVYIIKKFKLDIEMIEDNNTLLDLASKYNNFNLFIKLLDLGAGKNSNASVISEFYAKLSDNQKLSLKPYLPKLFIINPKINWRISLDQLFPLQKSTSTTKNNNNSRILSEVTTSTNRIISDEIWNKLFDSKTGRSIRSNQYGTRSVTLTDDEFGNGIYIKHKPQFPGTEIAVHKLCSQIFNDTLTPHCELASINQIPVLLSQQIPGETLIDMLDKDKDILNKIEITNISKQLIMAMLTNNGDGNFANFILVPNNDNKYILYSIDNDQCFMPSITKSITFTQNTLQVETVLFLFNQMNESVHQDVINSIDSLDIYNTLNHWLSDLKYHHRQSLDHFVSNRNQLKRDKESIIGVSFSDGMIEHLYSKLKRLKHLLNKQIKRENKQKVQAPNTHLQILEYIEPLIYNRYKQIINDGSDLPSPIIDKYSKLRNISKYSKELVTCSINTSSKILQSRAIPNSTDIQDQLWSGKYGPAQALGQLNTLNNQFQNLNQLLNKLKSSNSKNQNYIISNYDLECLLKADFENFEPNQQILFNYIKSRAISIINLKNSKQIQLFILKQFNLDNIVKLDLSGCTQIIQFEDTFSTRLSFKSLIKIKLNNCNQLTSIIINAPNLEYISATNCKISDAFIIDSSRLKYCNLNGSLTKFSSLEILNLSASIESMIPKSNFNDYPTELFNFKSAPPIGIRKYDPFSLSVSPPFATLLQYLNLSESLYKVITINCKSLRSLVLNSMKDLKKIYLQVPAIESIIFENCKSLREISTFNNNKELNNNLWNVLKQKDINRLKENNISINMVAAQEINNFDRIDRTNQYVLVPDSGGFILPPDSVCTKYYKVPATSLQNYSTSQNVEIPNYPNTISISSDILERLIK